MVPEVPFPYTSVSNVQAFVPEQAEIGGLANIHNKLHSQDQPYNREIDVKEVELFPISAIFISDHEGCSSYP